MHNMQFTKDLFPYGGFSVNKDDLYYALIGNDFGE